MRALILAGTSLLMLTGVSMAQGTTTPPPPAPPAASPEGMAPPPPGAEARDHGPRDHGRRHKGPRGDGPRGYGPRDDRGPGRGDMPPPPPPSKAAHFRVQQGDMNIDVKCADDEPMAACADIALRLVDAVQAQRP
ncbi:hypothetical protein QBK99_13390 [Corticibacterium sp. UT-5YL-CI-8]|nr:hypothetical protein [Tianweitania sp. UT-5YL-CI-8]